MALLYTQFNKKRLKYSNGFTIPRSYIDSPITIINMDEEKNSSRNIELNQHSFISRRMGV